MVVRQARLAAVGYLKTSPVWLMVPGQARLAAVGYLKMSPVWLVVAGQARLTAIFVVGGSRTSQARYYPCGSWLQDKPGLLLPVYNLIAGQARLAVTRV